MCYEEHKKKYPNENVQVTEISKKCSEKWKTMTDEEKRRFYELAQKDAERYQAEVAAFGGEDAMRKRKRAKKDPNAPKRALSAFFVFSQIKRPDIQQQHPDWKVGQVAQELGRMWKEVGEDKKKYEEMAQRDKVRYEQEMQDYKSTGKKQPGRMLGPGPGGMEGGMGVPLSAGPGAMQMMGMGMPTTSQPMAAGEDEFDDEEDDEEGGD